MTKFKYLLAFLAILLNTCILSATDIDSLEKVIESSNLPLIFLNTGGAIIPDYNKVEIGCGIVYNGNERNYIDDPCNDYDGIIGIETRGSSSSGWPKKNYGFETRYENGSNLNVSLLGLPPENDWILHGPYSDKSLIRNILAYHLGYDLGSWAPRTRLCEVFIDDVYSGVYVLLEKIKRDRNRLDIEELTAYDISGDALTGGYIIKIDRPDNYWTSAYPSPIGGKDILFSYVEPDFSDMQQVQKNYIKNYVDEFENALADNNFMDPVMGYRKYIDVNSFVDYFLISELSRNVDAYRLSSFLSKDWDSKGGKLTMGPIWDFDLAFGNADYYDAFSTDGWMIHTVGQHDWYQSPFWWDRLREDPDFNASLRLRWEQLRQSVFSFDHIEYVIDSLAEILDEAQKRNFETYPILGIYVWPNYFVADTWESEIDYMKGWISDRISWMDGQISQISITEEEKLPINKYEFSAYPNPFIDAVTLKFYFLEQCRVDLTICDAVGKILYKTALYGYPGYLEHSIKFNDNISPGIYTCLIKVDESLLITKLLIKSH